MTGSGIPVSGRPARAPGIWHNPDFRQFWMGQSISQIGTQVSQFTVPLLALALGLGEGSVGLLRAAALLPSLILAVPAGDLADRHRRRPLMLLADGLRALLTAAVVCAAALHALSLWELWVMLFISGSCAVLFDVCYFSVVPSLLPQGQLSAGNTALQASSSFATMAGPALAGVLIGFLPVWAVLVLDGISFVVSVLTLALLRCQEPPVGSGRKSGLRSAMVGLRQVIHSPLLRPSMLHTATRNVFAAIFSTYVLVFEIRQLHFRTAEAGALELVGNGGFLLGAVCSRRLAERIGIGPLICAGSLVSAMGMAVTVSARGPLAWLMIVSGLVCYGAGVASNNLQNVTLRQAITPVELFGRVTAALRLASYGALPLGALAGSALVPALGLRGALLVAAIGAILTSGILLCSEVRRVRALPSTEPVWGPRNAPTVGRTPPLPPSTALISLKEDSSVNADSADHPAGVAVVPTEQDLATTWDEHLRRDAGRPAALADAIRAQTELRRRAHPEGPVAVRPLLLHACQAEELTRVASRVIELVREECMRRAVDPFALAELLGVRPSPLLTGRSSSTRWATALARPDLVFSGGVPKVLECNISSATGGPETCALLDRVFWPSPEARYFAHRGKLRSGDAIGLRRELLLKVARERGVAHPYFAVAGWSEEYLSDALLDAARNGAPCVFVELEELIEDDGLRTGTGRRIDVLLLKFVTSSAYAEGLPLRALEDAVQHDSALLVSTELSNLYSNKKVLAWLTESAPSLPSAERAFIERHVPWTAELRDIRVVCDERRISLPTLLENQKDDFVLKPADGHSAQNVLVGRETDERAWRAAIEGRLERGHIAQKFCATDKFPMTVVPFGANEANVVRVPYVLGPLLVDGRFGGIMARFSGGDGLVINAARGGISTTFIWS